MIRLSSDMSPEARKMRTINRIVDIGKYTVLTIAGVAVIVLIVRKFF